MELEQMGFPLNEDRLEAALEDVTRALVSAVEMLRIPTVQAMHPPGEGWKSGLQQKMVVVPHQAIGVEEPRLIGDDRGENVQEKTAIGGISKDRSPLMAPAGDVVERARELQAKRSRHMHSYL